MKLKFIPIDYSSFDYNGKNYIKIVGRTDKGKQVCIINSYNANFWAIFKPNTSPKNIEKIKNKIEKIKVKLPSRTTKVEKTTLHEKKFLGKDAKALKIFITNHKDAHAVADKIPFKEIYKRREYDIPLISKYITESEVEPLVWYDVEGELLNNSHEFGNIDASLDLDICIKTEKINKSKTQPKFQPKILAYDIEADEFELGKGSVLMISLYGKNFKKVLTWKQCNSKQDFVECFKDETEMLEKFITYIKSYNPDILTGYFSDGFDLPYLRAVANKNKLKLSIGIDNTQPMFARGRIPSGKISGIVHLDIFRFIESAYSQYLNAETLSLNEVASELLGEKKHDFDFNKLPQMKEQDWKEFFAYNLQDSALTYKLVEKIWPDLQEFTHIIKQPLFETSRYAMSQHVENYILHNLKNFNEIAEKRPTHEQISIRRAMPKYEGAFVFQPIPGLYENLAFFDFTSMYASVIVSYNLSLSSFQEKKSQDSIQVNLEKSKAFFSKQKAFFPTMLEEIITLRKKYKNDYKKNPTPLLKARSNAYKLLANAAYGYQGFFGARYYCREAAASTAALAKQNILSAIEKIKSQNYKIIYSDTDSIAFLRENKSKSQALEMLKKINSELPGIMELELEDFYKRGLFVSKRTTKAGAKKKYALVDEKGKTKIRGFETVRRDWCKLARNLQRQVIKSILEDGNQTKALELIKQTTDKIKTRKINKTQLIIKTQLKKPINEYLSISPHVVAAQKMQAQDIPVSQGMVIEYFIAETRQKKSLVRDKVKLPDEKGEYNIKYYLNNQIIPAVENILEVFDVNIREVIEGKKQMKLGEF